MRPALTGILLLSSLCTLVVPARAAVESHAPEGIVEAFQTSDLVLLGERAWSKLDADLRNSIARTPYVWRTIDDIVIEFANSMHQDVLDAYVLRLEPVPIEELRKVWRDTTQPGTWESPVYQEFIEIVRRANMMTPEAERIRLIAGDPPIDWVSVHRWADTAPYRDRSGFMVDVIGREVLDKGRKALVIYDWEALPRNPSRGTNVTTRLAAEYPQARVFVVMTVPDESPAIPELEETIEIKQRPALVKLARSSIGMWPAQTLFEGAKGSLKQMADGLVYMGNLRDRPMRPSAQAARDTAYVRELRRRHTIIGR